MRVLKRLLCCLLILTMLGTPMVFAVDYTNEGYLSTAWDVTLGALDGVTGATCGIKGEVTYADATEVFVQDITGGICARFATAPAVFIGQTVTVVGQAANNHGLPELKNARVVLTADGTKPAAALTDLGRLQTYPRLYLNRLIRLEGVTIARIGDDGAPVLSDGGRELACYGLTTALPVGTTVDAELVFTVCDGSYRLRGSSADIREQCYSVTVKQFGLGSITPKTCTLPAGSSQRLTFAPADGQRLEQVWLNGQALGKVSEYTIENIQEDYTVCAVFLAAYEMPPDGSFSVTTSCTQGGSISPSQAVDFFGSSTVAVTPSEGWHVKDVQLDGASVGAVESYAIYNAEADHTITAAFERCYLISDAVPATCTQEGSNVSFCTLCGRLTKLSSTPAKEHTVVTDAAVAPTCTEPGRTAGSHCSVCNTVFLPQSSIPATGHRIQSLPATPPTCTEAGLTAGEYCDRCDYKLAQQPVDALGHSYLYISCNDGTHTVGCLRCDYNQTEACNTDGTDGSCSLCNYKQVQQECSHEWVPNAAFTVPPTCLLAGSDAFVCTLCGATKTEPGAPALGHATIIDAAVEATCTESGLTEGSHCSRCTNFVPQQPTPPLGHNRTTTDEDYLYCYQSCSRCGEKTLTAKAPLAYKDSPSAQFADIPEGWYRTAADYMLSEGLMGSTVTGKSVFAPMTDMSRAMLVTVLYRLEGSQKIENPAKIFTDVPDGKWYTEAVLWAADEGIVAGTKDGTTFSPNDNITREQIAAILYNYCVSYRKLSADKAVELSFFPDAGEAGTWAHTALRWAVAEGLINGRTSGSRTLLAPKGNAMRCEVAAVLTSLVKNILSPASLAG